MFGEAGVARRYLCVWQPGGHAASSRQLAPKLRGLPCRASKARDSQGTERGSVHRFGEHSSCVLRGRESVFFLELNGVVRGAPVLRSDRAAANERGTSGYVRRRAPTKGGTQTSQALVARQMYCIEQGKRPGRQPTPRAEHQVVQKMIRPRWQTVREAGCCLGSISRARRMSQCAHSELRLVQIAGVPRPRTVRRTRLCHPYLEEEALAVACSQPPFGRSNGLPLTCGNRARKSNALGAPATRLTSGAAANLSGGSTAQASVPSVAEELLIRDPRAEKRKSKER